jgi:hypothetical protein
MSEWSGSRLGYRGLWASVVLQALGDIWGQPIGSLDFSQAVAFFTGSGAWAESRTKIGDFLGFHRDDLEEAGRRCINARRASEGLPLETLRPSANGLSKKLLKMPGHLALPQRGNPHAYPRSWQGPLPSAA